MQEQDYKRLKPFEKSLFTDLVRAIKLTDKELIYKQIEEAANVGLELLSKTTELNYNYYRFKSCGHFAFLQPTHVRRNNFKCNTCYQNEVVKIIKEANMTFLQKVGPSQYRCLRQCGHVSDLYLQSLKSGVEFCKECFENKVIETCKKHNYTYVRYVSESKREIYFNECKHRKIIHHSQIFKGNAVCKACAKEKVRKDAEDIGLTLIYRGVDRYNTYKLQCGCIKVIREDHIRDGCWICNNCAETVYNKQSNIYLLRITNNEFSWLKLGFAKDISVRTNNYGLLKDSIVEIVAMTPTDSGYTAIKLEKDLHRKYSSIRYPKSFMKKYHRFNGFTECYPIEYESILTDELFRLQNNGGYT